MFFLYCNTDPYTALTRACSTASSNGRRPHFLPFPVSHTILVEMSANPVENQTRGENGDENVEAKASEPLLPILAVGDRAEIYVCNCTYKATHVSVIPSDPRYRCWLLELSTTAALARSRSAELEWMWHAGALLIGSTKVCPPFHANQDGNA